MVEKITLDTNDHVLHSRSSERKNSSKQLGILFLFVCLLSFSNSFAQLIPVVNPNGGLRIDGDLTADLPVGTFAGDWVPYYWSFSNSYDTSENNYVFYPNGNAVDPNTSRRYVDPYNDQDDNTYSGSKAFQNPADWKRTTSKPQNKSDINNAFYHIATDNAGSDWLFVGSDRLSTTGSGYIDFEFFQKPVYEDPNDASKFVTEGLDDGRTVNDVLITLSYSNGGSTATVDIYFWKPNGSGGFSYVKQGVSTIDAYGATNTSSARIPFGAFGSLSYTPYQFVEAAINMTAIMSKVVTNGPCIGVTVESLLVKTKSSPELTADLKDYIGPKPVQLIFGGANIAYNPLVVCNYYEKVLPDFSGVEGGEFSANSSDLKIDEDSGEIDVRKSKPGDYIITYTFTSYGCEKTVTAPFTVVPIPADKPSIASITQPFCATTTGELIVENPDPALTYFIRDENGANPEIEAVNGEFYNVQPDKYYLYSKTSFGCVSDSESFEIKEFIDSEDPTFDFISGNLKFDTDPGECSAVVNIPDAQFSDNCPGTIIEWTLTDDLTKDILAQGSGQIGSYTFPVGKSILEYTLTDASGNTKSDKFNIEIEDIELPVITVSTINTSTDENSCSATITMPSVLAEDNCEIRSLTGSRDDGLDLTAPYPLGTTTITWIAEDIAGNKSTEVDQIIEVEDRIAPVTPTLADVTVDCNGSLTAPTTTDNCAPPITGTTNDELSFVEGGSTVITWTFDDGNGNTTTANQTYYYDDTTAPVTPTLAGVTVDCNGSLTAPTTTDNCAPPITGTTTDELSFVEGGSTVITWTFNDGNGNTTTANQTYYYDDTTAPVTPTLADVTVDCNGSLTAPTTTDNCTPPITGTTTDELSFVEGGSTVITWTFDDGNGNTTTANQTYYYDDTTAPVTPTLADVTVDCNGSLTAPTTTDNCAAPITGTTNDELSFVEGGSTVITWTFDDGNGNTTTANQTYYYNDTTAPVTPTLADVTVDCNGSLTAPTTTDNCAPPITGTTTDELSFVEGGSTVITWTFDDGNGNTTTANQTYYYDDTTAPVTPTLADVTVDCNGSLTAPTTTDNCASPITGTTNDELSFVEGGSTVITWTFDDGNGNTTTANQTYYYDDTTAPVTPTLADVTVDCNGSLTAPTTTDNCAPPITGTTNDELSFVEGGSTVITWTFDDGNGNTTTANQTYYYDDTTAPVTPTLADVTVDCNGSLTAPTTTDACAGDITGTTTDELSFVEGGSTVITWTFDDGNGNTTTADQTYNYDDTTAPVTPTLADVTVDCNGSLTAPTTTDNCASPITGTTNDELSFVEGGSTVITWTFNDGNGNTTTANQTYYYDDTTAPVTPTLADVTVDCNGSLTAPNTTDNCAAPITGTTTDELSFVEGGSTVITWTFDDGNGNTTTANQTYYYDDTTAPVTPTLADVTVDCNGSLTAPSTTDNCAGDITGTTTDELSFVEGDSTVITWTFDDGNGNTTTATQTYNYDDTTAPVTPTLADVTVDCNGSLTAPTTTDNCAPPITGTTTDELSFVEGGSTVITWTFDDGNGNTTTANQTYYYDDTTAPVTPTLADVTVDCNGSLTAPTTTDNCAASITGTTNDELSFVEGGSTVITWTFDDGNGNTTTADQTYYYDDTTAPVTPTLADVTVDCNGSLTAPTTTDACAGDITGTTTDDLSFVEGGSTVITWTFDDGNGNTTTANQTYYYDDTTAPVTPTLADVTLDCNGSLTAPSTTDNCAGDITGTTTDELSFVEGDSTVITWTFDDGNGNTATADQTYYYDDTTAPVTPTLADVTVDCNGSLTAPTTTDNCAAPITGTTNDELSFVEGGSTVITWTFDDGNGNTTTANQTYYYDDTTAPVTPTLTDVTVDCNGSLTAPTTTDNCAPPITGTTNDELSFVEGDSTVITWTFDDGNGNTTTANQTYYYDDTTAPVTPTLADVTVDCNGSLTAPTTTDNCAPPITGTTNDELSFVEGGSTVITWTFDDGNGNTTTANQTYYYDDTTAPVTPTLADVTVDCNGSLTAPTTTDNCAPPITGTTNDELSFVEGGSTVITWTFDDGNGNTTTADQTYYYDDTTAPVTPTLADVTVDCNGSLTAPTTTDNCAPPITGTTTDELSFVEGGSTVITWTFDDGNGNTTTANQTYYYDDTTAPVTPTLADVTVDCNGSLTAPTTTDNCAPPITGTTTDELSFVEGGSTVITWTFDDGNGNTTTADQTYNYDDTTAPVTPTLADVTGQCTATATAPTTTDDCAGTITATTADSLTYSTQGTHVITWIFDDGNGQSFTVDQNVIIEDTMAPTITSCPVDITTTNEPGEDFAIVNFDDATASDNCFVNVVRTSSLGSGSEFPVGINEVSYLATDAGGNTAECSFNIIVKAIPVANDDSANTNEEIPVTIAVLENDTDFDSTILSIAETTNPTNGTIAINSDNTITYTPNNNFNGIDSFTYKITDGEFDSNFATVTVDVGNMNDAPVAADDAIEVLEGESTSKLVTSETSVLVNDSDVENNPLTAVLVSNVSHGILTLNSDGTFTYTHNGTENFSDEFTYVANDGFDNSNIATVSITITPVNDAPVAVNDAANTSEDKEVIISVLANDSDIDGDVISIENTTDPANGSITVNTDGTITYTPNDDFNGTDSFTYTITDGSLESNTATVSITVGATNDAPVAVNDAANTSEDKEVIISVLTNDSDIDGDVISIENTTDPANGSITVNADGTITYTPNDDFNGTDSFTYTITDGSLESNTATVSITVGATNDAPVAVNDAANTSEDKEVVISVLTNDSDIDGDVISIENTTDPANGSITVNADGTITYTPNDDFNGTDSFTYTITDGSLESNTATVSITVGATNDAPVAVNDAANTSEDKEVIISVLTNDSDIDGDVISIENTTDPANGSITVNADGTITYTPNDDFNGTDSFTYTITDGSLESNTATVSITVGATNDAPVAVNDAANTSEDKEVVISVLTNDSDIDGDVISIENTTDPANGSITVNTDGTITYTPNDDFNGTDSFTYTITDGSLESNTATVSITVGATNDAPVAVNDAANTSEDKEVIISVLTNDSDIDGDVISIENTTDPANGSITVNADGTITYTPNDDFNGTDSFTYTITDGSLESNTATVSITVGATNDAPVAVNDAANTSEDKEVIISVLTNDSDIDGDVISIENTTDPANGSITVNADGTITYTPNDDFNGTDSFTYTITDGNLESNTATVSITVGATNDAPVAVNDAANTSEDKEVIISVLTNDSDIDGDVISIENTTDPANGSITVNTDGTITYTPNDDFNGTDSFTYTITDGSLESNTATVSITVGATNDAPVAVNDAANTSEDKEVIISVLTNDSDIDGDVISIENTTDPANGSITVNADGTITYTPNDDFNGTDSFTYTITDGDLESNTATVSITVGATNDAPVAVNDAANTSEDKEVVISVLTNDSDIDGDVISIENTTDPANGSITVNTDGTITYTPNDDFNGTDSFTYTITDGSLESNTATVSITVGATNDAPVAVNDAANTSEDKEVIISVLTNDSDIDGDVISIENTTDPANGSITVNADGTITYTPNDDFNGTDSFTYTITDGSLESNTATVSITVGATNDAPVAVNDAANTSEDKEVVISVLTNDSDIDGDVISIENTTDPANGSITVNADGTITYTPNDDFNGTDSFTYTITDGSLESNTATVSITVGATNDAPVAVNDAANTSEDKEVVISVLTNDSDIDGDVISIENTTDPANGSITVNTDGTITYTPNDDFNGTDSFTYTITDGSLESNTATVSITVGATNDAPVAVNDAANTSEDKEVIISVLTNDSDIDGDVISIENTTDPANGSITVNADGTITYTPNDDFNGTDSFTYTITDGSLESNTATVSITVGATNDAPVAVNDAANTSEDKEVIISVLTNDSDIDGDVISIENTTDPANGSITVNADGTITYTPNDDFNGTDSFTYTITDGNLESNTATVSITVGATNDAPVAVNDAANTSEDKEVIISVLTNDSDIDGDVISIENTTDPANGSITVNTDGTITYTPNDDFNGTDSFTYTITDGSLESNTATVSITVGATNDAPVAVNDAANTSEDKEVIISVLTNDSDIDGDVISIENTTDPANGSITVNADGTITYTPNDDFNGTDSFTYTITDGDLESNTATVSITVGATNDAPVAVNDAANTSEDKEVVISVLTNDSDIDGDVISIENTTDPANGSITVNTDGTITYTPNDDFNGTDSFTYTITDGSLESNTATVSITVGATNDAPVAVNDAANTSEDKEVIISVLTNDSDIDGDVISIENTTDPANGSITVNADGTITYTPNDDFNGTDSFTYTITDGSLESNTATVSITVGATNDAPVAVNDAANTSEDKEVVISVLTNDSDIDGDVISIENTTDPANGSITVNADGTITYTPNDDFNGTDSFTYTITDGSLESNTATVSITVGATNDAPVAVNDAANTSEDKEVIISVLTNDSDIDGDVISIENTTDPANGSITVNADGTITYTPNDDFNGTDSFTYTITDGDLESNTATVSITVGATNDAPVAVNDAANTSEDKEVIISVLANDSDIDGDVISIENTTDPANGSITVNTDGTITYTPNENFNGEDTFSYTVSDGNGGTDTATVTVTVVPVNDAPVANDDSVETNQDVLVDISVLSNDTDIDGDILSVDSMTQPANGSVTTDGVVVTYTPNESFTGTDTFTYTITDNNGGIDTAEVTVNVLDTEGPAITCPTPVIINNDFQECGANYTFSLPVVSDNSGVATIVQTGGPLSGELFPVGETVLSFRATDNSGNSTECSYTVTVLDNEAPVITSCAANITIEADQGSCSASEVDLGTLIAEDNCDNDLSISNDAPEVFVFGETTVTWTVTDNAGNTTECTQIVNIIDTQAPVITMCAPQVNTTADFGVCYATGVNLGAVTAEDNCDSDLTITNNAPESFPVGTTQVTWTVTDASGNSTECIQLVNVVDDQAPVIQTMENIIVNNDTGNCGAVVEYEVVQASDNCNIDTIIVTEGPASGEIFPVGTTTVTYTVTDVNANKTSETFTVTVNDTEAPALTCPADITVDTQTGESYARVDFEDATVTDNCGATVEQTAGPVSGSNFGIGTTIITFTATDAAGNTTECSFSITVEDNEDPTLECPEPINTGTDAGICGAIVTFETPAGFDNSGNVTVEQIAGPASGNLFPVGTTTVSFEAKDASGNTAVCSFTITVADDEAPEMDSKDNLVVNNDPGICGAIVNFEAPAATDNCGIESVVQTEGPVSGSEFPVGTTTITYTATDTAGLTATSSFSITVEDNEAPVIDCPEDIFVNVEYGTTSIVVEYNALIISENCGNTTTQRISGLASGEEFPVGITTISYVVTDSAGNTTECSFELEVIEDAPPAPPAAPNVNTIAATCIDPFGTIAVEVQGGLVYSIDGVNFQEDGVFADLEPGTYEVTARDEFGQMSESTIVVIEIPFAQNIQASDIELCVGDSIVDLNEQLAEDTDDTGVWTDPANTGALDNGFLDPSMLEVGNYTFIYTLTDDCQSSTGITVTINDDCVVLPCTLSDIRKSISKVVTPNGDNQNDFFTIDQDVECDFIYDVMIFNRWGAKVFEAENYQNNWDGQSQKSFTSSNQLPSGTYYYFVKMRGSEMKPIQGYIFLGTK